MEVLKPLARFFGKSLISFTITLFILTFFAIPLTENVNIISESMDAEALAKEVIKTDLSDKEIDEICQKNPNQENCDIVNNPSLLLQQQLEPIVKMAEDARPKFLIARWASIALFILGIILIYLGTSSGYETAYKTSTTVLLTSLFYAVFYKMSLQIIPSIGESMASSNQEVPQALVDMSINAITKWIELPAQKAFTVCLILVGVSLLVAIPTYIQKKKEVKKQSSQHR